MDKFKMTFISAIVIIGSGFSYITGGWTGATMTLLLFMCIDYITGFIVSAFFHNSPKSENGGLSSKVGFQGLFKKMCIIIFLFIAYRLDLMLGVSYVKDGVCYAFIVNELISIIENAHYMGVEPPSVLSKAIDVIKEKDSNNQ